MGLFDKFKQGLKKTKDLLFTDVRDLFKSEGELVDDVLCEKLYARLIPVEHVGPGGDGPINTIVKHIYETGKPPNP